MEQPIYLYNYEKNLKLIKERGIGFEEIITILDAKGYVALIDHPNPAKYPGQKMYVVEIDCYIYLVPFEQDGNKLTLKTIYPSRKMTRFYSEKLSRGE